MYCKSFSCSCLCGRTLPAHTAHSSSHLPAQYMPPSPSSTSHASFLPSSLPDQMNPRVMSIPEMKEYAQELPYRMQAKQQLSKCELSFVVLWLRWSVCMCGHTQTPTQTPTHPHTHLCLCPGPLPRPLMCDGACSQYDWCVGSEVHTR